MNICLKYLKALVLEKFTSWISLHYKDVHSMLKINGILTRPFSVHRGVRQGCSLSGLLYTISIVEDVEREAARIDSSIILPLKYTNSETNSLCRRHHSDH